MTLHADSAGSLEAKESDDIRLWDESLANLIENNDARLFHRLLKAKEFMKLEACRNKYHQYFAQATDILEVGGGCLWASYLIKRLYPKARVIGSDIAPGSVKAHEMIWKSFFETSIDGAFACKSYEIPVDDSSFDLVFSFESAHHFGKHRRTFEEMFRVVRKGGTVLYLAEPACHQPLYKMAHARVNAETHGYGADEDVLIPERIVALAEAAGFEARVDFDPHCINRGEVQSVYYAVLKRLPFLQGWLPCTANFIFRRP